MTIHSALSKSALSLCLSMWVLSLALYAQNQVMGEVHFIGPTKVEKSSGVWVDDQYVGYVKELKETR
jgi:hypothetical protein